MPELRIGIDGRPLTQQLTGVGRYTYELCKVLDREIPEGKFFVYSNTDMNKPVTTSRWNYRVDRSFFGKKLKKVAWLKLRCGKMCRDDQVDVFWGTASFLPDLRRIPNVLTVYDMNYRLVPKTMSLSHLLAFRMFFEKDVGRATSVTCISNGTAQRLKDWVGRSCDSVIYPGIGDQFVPAIETNTVFNKFNIGFPYILAVATWEPRKNLEILIRCFLRLRQDPKFKDIHLVLVGGRGWKDQRLVDLIGVSKQNIHPLGFVSDHDLPALYSGCAIFAFPSQYEGFGIPVAEAIACGAKVLTTDIPELREAGGENAIYKRPTESDILEGLKEGILSEQPPLPSKRFFWEVEGKKLATQIRAAIAAKRKLS
jgi:glycosyltransferase involved in cell wall biosynthesis